MSYIRCFPDVRKVLTRSLTIQNRRPKTEWSFRSAPRDTPDALSGKTYQNFNYLRDKTYDVRINNHCGTTL